MPIFSLPPRIYIEDKLRSNYIKIKHCNGIVIMDSFFDIVILLVF